MLSGILPIGTVVLLKESTKRVMIIGVLQKELDEEDGKQVLWDYAAVFYPEGYMGPDKTFLFNTSQIEKVYAVGYQDEEQFAFKEKIDQVREDIMSSALSEE